VRPASRKLRPLSIGLALLAAISGANCQQQITLRAMADSSPTVTDTLFVIAPGVPFSLVKVTPSGTGPDFVVLSPSSGVGPATVGVGLNPTTVPFMRSGAYSLAVTFSVGPPAALTTDIVNLLLSRAPQPIITSVVSAASFQPNISPSEIVSLFGTNLGTPPIWASLGPDGLYPTDLGNTTVTFNGVAAPLLYVSKTQINAVVPNALAGQGTVSIVVTHDLQQSPTVTMPVLDTSPGIFAATQNGSGQGVILNVDTITGQPTSLNSTTSPAPRGSAITMFGTGAGLWSPAAPDGSILLSVLQPRYTPVAPVSLTIGGQPAKVLYAGAASYQVSGFLQVNAVVPDGIGSGPQSVVLTIGQNSNAQQQITVVIQ
jgi:uncharacterized protein (TIGR03437 family)